MREYDAGQVAELLPYGQLSEAIAEVLSQDKKTPVAAPGRQILDLPGGACLLVMPVADKDLAVTKLVTVHPGNAGGDLPVVESEVLVMDAHTGLRLATLEGKELTARRTAALSLLAARKLAPEPDGELLVMGAGTQAAAHLEAFAVGLGVKRAFVCSRTKANAQRLARRAKAWGVEARAVDSPEDILGRTSMAVTATTSPEPVLPEDVGGVSFIAAVGAFTPLMAELPAALVKRSRLYADTMEGVRTEGGDYIRAGVDWERVTPLAEALDGGGPDRKSEGETGGESNPVIFKSVGHALFDLAAARLAVGLGGPK